MKKIIIVGSGGIGRACGLILAKYYKHDIQLVMADTEREQCMESLDWIKKGLGGENAPREYIHIEDPSLKSWNPTGDIILDCSPGANCLAVAEVALRNQMHYANLTENVPETKKILKLVGGSHKGFVLQTGLAPGFINVYTRKLIDFYNETHAGAEVENVKMRVGALSACASSPSYYAFTWSPAGVSTEYLNKAEVLKDGIVQFISSLSEREEVFIKGELFEADLTSGGSSDLPDHFQNSLKNLDYKSLRYPGHYSWIEDLKNKLGNNLTAVSLREEMLRQIPFQQEDRVVIYISVSGRNKSGHWIEETKFLEVGPIVFHQIKMSAIQRTTASALAQCAKILMQDGLKGAVLQSRMPVDLFLQGHFVEEHYGRLY